MPPLSMPRARTDLPDPAVLRAQVDAGGRLAVRVTPGARVEGIAIEGGRVLVKVRARPQDGAANAAVLALLAAALGLAASRLRVLRGATSRDKLIGIDG